MKIRKTANNPQIVPVLESDRKTGFRGYISSIISVNHIYRKFVEEKHWLLFLATYRLSQDHIEIFFGKIRSRNGSNDNPNIQQFEGAYRKLLHQSDISISSLYNIEIIDKNTLPVNVISNILTISSRRPKLFESVVDNNEETTNYAQETENSLLESIETDCLTDLLNDSGVSFLAFKLESKLLECAQIYCEACHPMLQNNEKLNRSRCVGNNQPCVGTYKICKSVSTALKIFANRKNILKTKVRAYVLSNIDINQLYPLDIVVEHNGNPEEHISFIAKYFIDSFVSTVQTKSAKNKYLSLHEKFFRQINCRNTKVSGQ